jgi:hypothetical protein
MKPTVIAGVLLILMGVIALAYQGISYTSRDTVLDIGPLHATAEREHTLHVSPLLGAAAIAAGAILLFVGSRPRT